MFLHFFFFLPAKHGTREDGLDWPGKNQTFQDIEKSGLQRKNKHFSTQSTHYRQAILI